MASPLALFVHGGDVRKGSGEEGGGGGYPLSILATVERAPSNGRIRLVRSVPALQFRAFLLGRRCRQHDAAGVPAVQGPGSSAPRHISYGGLFASDSVSEASAKAWGRIVTEPALSTSGTFRNHDHIALASVLRGSPHDVRRKRFRGRTHGIPKHAGGSTRQE
jgi:hypothetical protein